MIAAKFAKARGAEAMMGGWKPRLTTPVPSRPELAASETLPFPSAEAFRQWLEANHETAAEVWVLIAKKSTGIPTVGPDEAIDEAICFGWIDGQRRKHDDTYYLQRYTPRRTRSRWSRINVERVGRLDAEGKLRPAGLREIEAAKADGRWEAAYASPANITVPADLRTALDASPIAAARFAQLNGANRYAILFRIESVKKAETRARKIAGYVADLENGVTPYPQKRT